MLCHHRGVRRQIWPEPRRYRPRPPLAGFVDWLGGWEHDAPAGVRDRALSRGAVTLTIDLGPQRFTMARGDDDRPLELPRGVICGPHATSYLLTIPPRSSVLTVHFGPGGAFPFLGVSPSEVANLCVGIDAVWGRDADRLEQRLAEEPTLAGRCGILESFLLKKADPGRVPQQAVALALDAFDRAPTPRVAEVSALTGLSPKRLIARFRDEVGLSPKTYAQVRRFQAALPALRQGRRGGAAIASDAGYFDQAHLVREFRRFAAMTPTQYQASAARLPNHVAVAG
jgi:AraC-like DNA-binding protein